MIETYTVSWEKARYGFAFRHSRINIKKVLEKGLLIEKIDGTQIILKHEVDKFVEGGIIQKTKVFDHKDIEEFVSLVLINENKEKKGLVSERAIWLKVGDAVSSDDVKYDAYIDSKKSKHLEVGDTIEWESDNIFFKFEGEISEINLACEDAWDWKDKFTITNVRRLKNVSENTYEYFEDVIKERQQVKPKQTVIPNYEIKCPYCETFH